MITVLIVYLLWVISGIPAYFFLRADSRREGVWDGDTRWIALMMVCFGLLGTLAAINEYIRGGKHD